MTKELLERIKALEEEVKRLKEENEELAVAHENALKEIRTLESHYKARSGKNDKAIN